MTHRVPVLVLLALLSGCSSEEEEKTVEDPKQDYSYAGAEETAAADTAAIFLSRSAAEMGIDFVHTTGADGRKLMPETMGPGCGLSDLDGDGRLDAILVDGAPWQAGVQASPTLRVYRGTRAGFIEITADLGLDTVRGYGMGIALADYDADDDQDLALTTVFGTRLLRNDSGRYTDVTGQAGLAGTGGEWGTSVVWADFDRDGWLDLFIANYVRWSVETDVFTTLNGTDKSYAVPTVYEGVPNRLYRNLGDGTFEDVSSVSGVDDPENKALGLSVIDVNADAAPDLFVANDTTANKLYVNDGAGRLEDMALVYGVAYDELGRARAGMGVDSFGSSERGIVVGVGNFSDESVSMFESIDDGSLFVDSAQRRGIAVHTQAALTFGLRFADFNHDAVNDLLLVNGHIEPEINEVRSSVSYRQPLELYLGTASGRFAPPRAIGAPIVGRCVAVGDIDGDLDQDALVTENGAAPVFLINQVGPSNALTIDLEDKEGPNRAGIGAKVRLSAGDWSVTDAVRARGSYLGHSPYTLHLTAPTDPPGPFRLEITWPDGAAQTEEVAKLGQKLTIARRVPSSG